MNNSQVLIITDDRSRFSYDSLQISPDSCQITGIDSLLYIGLTRFASVVIDCKTIAMTLKKVSLGIRDDSRSEALWQLLSKTNGPKIYMLILKKQPPTREMIDLGVEYTIMSEIKTLAEGAAAIVKTPAGTYAPETNFGKLLTADDVRALHQSGARYLPAGAKLTSWASEVAESLQMGIGAQSALKMLYPVKAETKAALKSMSQEIFDLESKYPEMLFLVTPPLIPVFNAMFPALRGKIVSPVIHWAKQGAFTGEVSASMLAEQHCFGAIIPDEKPYKAPKALADLIKQAADNFLTLFSTFTLASNDVCGIIASNGTPAGVPIQLYTRAMMDDKPLPTEGAVVADKIFLSQISKGH